METSSTQKLSQNLICSAIQRCRISENICRLSVVLKCSSDQDGPIVRISISDTGVGICLEEFQDLNYTKNHVSAEMWDGVLSITTTSICDEEIYHYKLNLRESVAARRLTRLASTSKNGGKFSGTEISLSTYESADYLAKGITSFLQKMAILKIPKVAIELTVDRAHSTGSKCENLFLANEGLLSLTPVSNIERLISGLEDHVLKHGNTLDKECQSCFSSREDLKVGIGVKCSAESIKSTGQVIEAVIIITELPELSSPSCLAACRTITEVFYFQDFLPCSIPLSCLNALISIDWKSYGLGLRTNTIGEDGHTVLEWEKLPPFTNIDIVIHCYHKQFTIPRAWKKVRFDRNLVKKAIKLALDDLKEKYSGIFLSEHAQKIQSYAPDLARTIAGLVLSSNDTDFQGECISLLGLQPQENVERKIEDLIKEKIITVIEMNDRKSERSRESAPFLLFEDEDEDEEDFAMMDV